MREVEVRAARLEGIAEAKQVVEHERSQLQQQHQDKLSQLQSQEQQVTVHALLVVATTYAAWLLHARSLQC